MGGGSKTSERVVGLEYFLVSKHGSAAALGVVGNAEAGGEMCFVVIVACIELRGYLTCLQ